MRPHKLRMKAFGPFAEEAVVDFDRMGNNIFLISGDTGIGKTTIFDGMIYALYGKASGGSRSSLGTEALHSDYCKDGKHKDRLEVEFTFSNAGRTYTVSREMNWGKNGNSQTAIKESALSENGTVLIRSKGREDRDEVTLRVQEILGLDADQFRRIIMLAQGEFQKFLTSGSDDRGKILGKLFDNRKHIDLQMRLKAAYRLVDNRLRDNTGSIRAQTDTFVFPEGYAGERTLNADDTQLMEIMLGVIAELEKECSELTESIKETEAALLSLNKEMTLAENNNKRLDELGRKRSALEGLKMQDAEIEALKIKTIPAKAAKELIPLERAAGNAQLDLERLTGGIIRLTAEKERLGAELSRLAAAAEETERNSLPKIEEYKKQKNTLEGMLRFYDELREAETALAQCEKKFGAASAGAELAKKELDAKKERLKETADLLASLENAGDPAVNEAKRLLDEEKKRSARLLDLENGIRRLYAQEKELAKLEKAASDARVAAHEAEGEHYRLNGAFLSGQAGLLAQDMRLKLQTSPEVICPVCGTKHSAENAPSFALCREDIPTREQVDSAFSRWSSARDSAAAIEKNFSAKQAEYNGGVTVLLELSAELIGVDDKDELWKGTALIAAKNQNSILLKEYEAGYSKAAADRARKNNAADENRRLGTEVENAESALAAANEKLRIAGEERSAASARADEKRKALEGCPASKQETEWRIGDLSAKADVLNRAVEKAKSAHSECQKNAENLVGRLTAACAEKETAEEKAKTAQLEFEAGLVRYGFGNREEYLAAKSPDGRLLDPDSLGTWIRNAERRISDHILSLMELEANIRQLEEDTKDCVRIDLNETRAKIGETGGTLRAMRERDKLLGAYLSTDRTVYGKVGVLLRERRKYLAAAEKIKPLSDSANGNYTFSRYVLNGFFRRIIDQANVHLDTMTDGEYSLVSKETGDGRKNIGLDLKVYNSVTGLERETGSLSGGQLFEASLSLALGLSDVVQMESSSTVQIDSMFIDEGFGSLDSARLDKAIEVLQHLSAGRRQIGIISHVARLDECLPKKIHVVRRTNGAGSEILIETDE